MVNILVERKCLPLCPGESRHLLQGISQAPAALNLCWYVCCSFKMLSSQPAGRWSSLSRSPLNGHVSLVPRWRSAVSGGQSCGGSGLLPSFSWRVNYTVGGAGGPRRCWPLRLCPQQHVRGACGLCWKIHLITVSQCSGFTPHEQELLRIPASTPHPHTHT